MVPGINQLLAADEGLNHQIANTFASVATADRSWTEKIWCTLVRKSGGVQVNFGLGKYPNRNVLDGFAGVARGRELRIVRASRELKPAVDDTAVGPVRYQVIEPYQRVRLQLADNDVQPIRFELEFQSQLPPFFEGRDVQYKHGRNSSDVVRYHQCGSCSGWIEADGQRIEVRPDDWFAVRDHSWGTRESVGLDPPDVQKSARTLVGAGSHFHWLVGQLQRPDGSRYELAYYFRENRRGLEHFTGFINEADGTQMPVLHVHPELDYRARDHAALGGTLQVHVRGAGGRLEERRFTLEAIDPELGFRLHPQLYFPWKGMVHGSWKGALHVDGDCIADCDTAFTLEQNPVWQVRDRPMRIREGDNAGHADLESCVIGDWPGARMVDRP